MYSAVLYVEPVIWNKTTGRVVGGHQRLKVLQDMGITEVDCVVVELSEEKEKALNIALNKISGEWDKEKLALLITDLQGADFVPKLPPADWGITCYGTPQSAEGGLSWNDLLAQLNSLTKLTIPNGNVSPGWGPVAVVPVEPVVPVPPVTEVAVTEKVKAKV